MKIALVQSSLVWGDVDKNLTHFDRLLKSGEKADVILLPEMFVSGAMMMRKEWEVSVREKEEVAARYEEVKERMSEWAMYRDALVIGSTVCREMGNFYNRLVVAFPDGRFLHYDKRHCFRIGGEHEHFSVGTEQLVFEFRGVRIAAFICYDLRFPVWCRNTREYDLAVFVANWPESRREVWQTLLKARAIENQAYVAGVNCVGTDRDGLKYSGDSALIDPYGRVIGEAAPFTESVLTLELDKERVVGFRKKFPVLDDRDDFKITGNTVSC